MSAGKNKMEENVQARPDDEQILGLGEKLSDSSMVASARRSGALVPVYRILPGSYVLMALGW